MKGCDLEDREDVFDRCVLFAGDLGLDSNDLSIEYGDSGVHVHGYEVKVRMSHFAQTVIVAISQTDDGAEALFGSCFLNALMEYLIQ